LTGAVWPRNDRSNGIRYPGHRVSVRLGTEVVDEGVTGYVVDPDDALSAIDRAAMLDRRRVRNRFEQRFTAHRMAEDYVRIYNDVIGGASRRPVDESAELRISAS
jgi:hypothetical protein